MFTAYHTRVNIKKLRGESGTMNRLQKVFLTISVVAFGMTILWGLSTQKIVIKVPRKEATPAITEEKTKEETAGEYETDVEVIGYGFLDDAQKEVIELYEKGLRHALRVKKEQNVIFAESLPYVTITNWQLIDIDGDGRNELYIEGAGDGVTEKELYKFSDNGMVSILNMNGIEVFFKDIKKTIEGNRFTCSFLSEGDELFCSGSSLLPPKLFFNIEAGEDPNGFLVTSYDWVPIKKENSWYIDATATIKIKAGQYYWGPPVLEPDPSEYTDFHCDIARFHITLQRTESSFSPIEARLVLNYPETAMPGVDLLDFEEATFGDNISLLSDISEVYRSLGGSDEEESGDWGYVKEIDGVTLTGFVDDSIINIRIESDKYPTKRGLKVGDSIEDLKSLYGIPDQGFFEDEMVTYYFSFTDIESGETRLTYYRKMNVKIENGKITMIEFDQMASD